MNGWIKIYRQFLSWEWFNKSEAVHLFIYLLLKANHKRGQWQGINIDKGQFITSFGKISVDTGISLQTIRTLLKKFEKTNEINIQTTNKFSIITICKYECYQQEDDEANTQVTNNQHSTNNQLTTNKNVKNNKEEKYNIDISAFLNWFNSMKERYVGKVGQFKSLNKVSINNLKLLKQKKITAQEFEHSFKMMCKNIWVQENQMITPSHFLINDNFYRYLNQEDNTTKTESEWKPTWL